MKNKTSIFVRLLLILMITITLAMCILWLPDTIEYCKEFISSLKIFNVINTSILLYIFVCLTATPIFLIFIISFRFSSYIEKDMIFHADTAKLLRLISYLLIGDCTLFIIGTVFLFSAGERILSPVFAFVAAIGLTVACMLGVLSDYVYRAAILKEEADLTL